MENKDFDKHYNGLQEAKKRSVTITMVQQIASVVIIIAVLIWAYSIHRSTLDSIVVVDTSGRSLETKTVRGKELTESLVTAHCERTVSFANSFDRFTLKSNQANTYFLMNKIYADKVFASFKAKNMYNDVLQIGWQYECKFKNIVSLQTEKLPYKVQFISEIIGRLGEKKIKFLVKSEGEIDLHTPQYPENPFGYFFTQYVQQISKINDHGQE